MIDKKIYQQSIRGIRKEINLTDLHINDVKRALCWSGQRIRGNRLSQLVKWPKIRLYKHGFDLTKRLEKLERIEYDMLKITNEIHS